MEYQIQLPKKIKIVNESDCEGVYEIEDLFPGYGYTIGHSLRRVILSSMPGAAITRVKIEGVSHEFSTIEGVKEDVVNIILNLKQVRFKIFTDDSQTFTTIVKGPAKFTAGDFQVPSQLEIINKDLHLATITGKDTIFNIEITVEKGLGYTPKEMIQKDKMEVGAIALDAIFTPIRKVNYEVENMRVGERTDYNKVRLSIETDCTIKPFEVLETAIKILMGQFKSILGQDSGIFEEGSEDLENESEGSEFENKGEDKKAEEDVLKIRVEDLDFSTRTFNALSNNGIRTIGGIVKKRESELIHLEGVGEKAIKEIRRSLGKLGLSLKE